MYVTGKTESVYSVVRALAQGLNVSRRSTESVL
jgi:hypothetical protein